MTQPCLVTKNLAILQLENGRSPRGLLVEHCHHILLEILGIGGGGVAFDGGAVSGNQEFGEVPLDVAVLFHALADGLEEGFGSLCLQSMVFLGGCLRFEILENRVGICAVDIDFFHNLESYAIVQLAETLNLAVAARVLRGILIARKTNHNQSLVLEFLVQCFQTCKLRSETALARCVDNQQHLTLKLLEIEFLTSTCESLKIVNLCHIFNLEIIYIVHDIKLENKIYIASDIFRF